MTPNLTPIFLQYLLLEEGGTNGSKLHMVYYPCFTSKSGSNSAFGTGMLLETRGIRA